MYLTVVVPARNEEGRISKCISSVYDAVAEASLEAEILVVDDASSDHTASEAAAAGANVIRHLNRLGQLAAWGTGVSESNSDFIVFVDADCIVHKKALNELLKGFDDLSVGVVGGRPVALKGSRESLASQSARFSRKLIDEICARINNHDFLAPGALMAVRREAWNVTNTTLPHCDRVVAAAARSAGWVIIRESKARVFYKPSNAYSGVRADWLRTRFALRSSVSEFDPLPKSVLLAAMVAATWRSPAGALSWAICHTLLTIESRIKRIRSEQQPVFWDPER